MKKLYLLTLVIFFVNLCFSQELNPDRKFVNYFYDAEAYMYENNYDAALDLLLKLEEMDPKNPNIWYKIGYCYLNTRLYKKKAQAYLEKAVDYTNPNYKSDNHRETSTPLETYLYLAQAYRINYQFDLSLQALKDLRRKLNPSSKEDQDLLKQIEREENITKNAIEFYKNPVDAYLKNLGPDINTPYADHSPIIDFNENVLIFTSKRPRDGEALQNQDEDIFISKSNNYKWQKPVRLGEPVNTKEQNEAAIGLSIDGKQMFFFRSGYNNTGNIYVTESSDGYNWSDPKFLREDVNSKYRETHAVITPDGNSIFFTSNRKGGFGGTDIYVMRCLPDGKWSRPQLLPEQVNTPFDEESPFVHPDGITLFFSSKGHNTMGGYDVFYTKMNRNGTFTEPVNLGYPINTPDDDVSYIMNMDGRRGYIATVKDDSYGDLDIYEIIQSGIYDNNLVVYDGIVSDINNNIPDNLIIAVRDVKTEEYVGIYRPNKKDGKYLIVLLPDNTYEIAYEADGYLIHAVEYTPTRDDVKKFTQNFLPIELDPVLLQAYLMHDFVYFNENSMELDDEAIKTLNKVIQKCKEWKGESPAGLIININLPIVGADPVKDSKRSSAIVNYIIANGIDKSKIYLNGNYPQGYNDVYGLDIRERREILATSNLPIQEELFKDKKPVYVENIFFDFDRYNIKPNHIPNLEILANFLVDNPEARIEIEGHTDYLGSNEYNYLLSYRRAKSVKDFLVNKGANAANIITTKYGEDKPIAPNTFADGRDNPVGRQLNRRAQFKVLNQGVENILIIKPIETSQGEMLAEGNQNTSINQAIDRSKKYTIQIYALKNPKPVDYFADLVGVKMHVSEDGWYRYYVGEFNSYGEAKAALDNLKKQGYNPFIRKLSFFEK